MTAGAWSRLPRALRTTITRSALPYGYTLTVWSSGAVLMHRHGPPGVGDVFLFIAGGGVAFALLAALASRVREAPLGASPGRFERAGALNALASGGGVGLVALLAGIHGHLAWPVGSFTGTLTYLLVATVWTSLDPAAGQLPRHVT
jgi:hypothetical protein